MIVNKAALEVKLGEKLFQFICHPESSLDDVAQVLSLMFNHIQKKGIDEAEKAKALQKPVDPEPEKPPEA